MSRKDESEVQEGSLLLTSGGIHPLGKSVVKTDLYQLTGRVPSGNSI